MALVTLSGISEIRGSIGTTTYSRNRVGLYARARQGPKAPTSPFWQFAYGRMNYCARNFRNNLNPDELQRWCNWAKQNPATNRLGMSCERAGCSAYVECNYRMAVAYGGFVGQTPAGRPPQVIVLQSINGYLQSGAPTFDWAFTSDTPYDTWLWVRASAALGPAQRPRVKDMGVLNLWSPNPGYGSPLPLVVSNCVHYLGRYPARTWNGGERVALHFTPVDYFSGRTGQPLVAELLLS